MISKYTLARAMRLSSWKSLFVERFTEPIHLNLLSIFVLLFGTYRQKVLFDLVLRRHYVFPILWAADNAKKNNIKRLSIIEFGVASGEGLLNMCEIAAAVTKATGVQFDVYGFDSSEGLPEAVDYRDSPERFQQFDYPMHDPDVLRKRLPQNSKLIIGMIRDTIPSFLETITVDNPIGFVSVDVDYYSSCKECFEVFNDEPGKYLPVTLMHLDDITAEGCDPWTGEYLAVNEFNEEKELRKISPFNFLRAKRIFKNVSWIDQIYAVHFHDHPVRQPSSSRSTPHVLNNEYL